MGGRKLWPTNAVPITDRKIQWHPNAHGQKWMKVACPDDLGAHDLFILITNLYFPG